MRARVHFPYILKFWGLLFCWVLLGNNSVNTIYAQDINLRFQHFTSDDGLSQNTVDCILKDSRGFMWFGTWNGLNRFDGYGFVIYKSDNQPNSLSNNFIYAICEDRNGNLWVGTKSGLNRFNYNKNTFTRYFQKDKSGELPDNNISSIICDSKGVIWIGTSKGLVLARVKADSPDSVSFENYAGNFPDALRSAAVNVLFEDKNDNLWVGTNNGLIKLDRKRNSYETFVNDPFNFNSITYNVINTVYEDKDGLIWVGTQFGLNRLNVKTKNITQYFYNSDFPKSISHFVISDIKEDNNGNLLIATLGGLNKYNHSTNNFDLFPINQNDDYSLNNQFINSLFVDKEGNIWIGTDKGGVNKFSIYQKQFGYIFHDPANKNSISNNTINSIYDEQGKLWIGTAGGGLNMYDKKSGKNICYNSDSHYPQSINNNFVSSIIRDKKNNLWVGTWGGGLNQMTSTAGKGSFTKYVTTNDPGSISDVYISSIIEDPRGFLVIGTLSGLDLYYPQLKKFRHIANNPNWANRISEVGCLLLDSKGFYWIGTRIGLFKISADKIEKNFQDTDIEKHVYSHGSENSLAGNYVISLCEDKYGNIWAGTYGNGLCKLETASSGAIKFQNYTDKDGLANNVVYAILEDTQHNLWISTDNGLSRFDVEKKVFKNFYITDGLQSNQFYWSAACKGGDGKMYFGGIKGINYFLPDSIKDYPFRPKVVLTDLKIFNNSVGVGIWNKKRIILDKPISEIEQITLSYKENVFSLEFSALDYYLPEKIRYVYMMVGVDNDWVDVPSTRRFANYTNLKGGEYIFKVKAKNSDGVSNENPTILKIIIRPPFYDTTWFRIVAIILITLSIVFYFQYRTQKLKSRKRILEKMVTERTQQIEEQKIQLELQNKEISEQRDKLIELNKRVQLVNQLKLRFFTNISHEFRTPLTLILGPLEKLLHSWKGDEITRETLLLINRNAQRLLHLINQLMEFRKIETGKQELKVSKGNIISFVENIFQSFGQLSKQRNIEYRFVKKEITNEAWFDHDKLENVLFNLLSNAFKYTPENGIITLTVESTGHSSDNTSEKKEGLSGKFLSISVTDTGIGIDKEHLNNIFKRFFRINTPDNLQIKGSGIGLSLTRELIRAHHGSISVESKVGEGTSFILQLPFQKENFSEKEIVETSYEPKNNFESQIEVLTEEIKTASEIRKQPVEIRDGLNRPVLLIVEDNYDLRSFLAHSLASDFAVYEAENGKQGLELAKSYSPDLVLSDVMMPEMDGLELCTKLKEGIQTSHIPVVLLTARSAVENWIEGFETGADDYIAKPFNLEVLKARISNIIENRRELKKLFTKNFFVEPAQIATTSADEQFLKKAIAVVEENFSDPEFSVEKFIDKMSVSRSLLHKKLSALTEQSAGDFITSLRLKKSIQLLQTRSYNISEIAYQVGFNDPKYFSRIFKKHFGVTPTEYTIK